MQMYLKVTTYHVWEWKSKTWAVSRQNKIHHVCSAMEERHKRHFCDIFTVGQLRCTMGRNYGRYIKKWNLSLFKKSLFAKIWEVILQNIQNIQWTRYTNDTVLPKLSKFLLCVVRFETLVWMQIRPWSASLTEIDSAFTLTLSPTLHTLGTLPRFGQ